MSPFCMKAINPIGLSLIQGTAAHSPAPDFSQRIFKISVALFEGKFVSYTLN